MSDHINAFAGIALERNAERRDEADWAAAQCADRKARFLLLNADAQGGHRALIESSALALRWLSQDERQKLVPQLPLIYLGADEIGPLFALCASHDVAALVADACDGTFIDLRSAGLSLHPFQAGAFALARAIAHWQARARFCGACGAPLRLFALGHRAKCTNPICALDHFPRIDPAMIVIVSWRDQCLLGTQSTWAPGRYSTLAGFVEAGESLEDAVRREVFEESGVRVGACHYHSSQPWPFPSSLMLGFTAQATDPAIKVGCELSDARWFGVDDIVNGLSERTLVLPPRLSVSHELIAHWLRETAGLDLADLLSSEPWQAQAR